ncbi:hypothetical protein F4782DRAFT_513469 [Xylaria castorea]|nr:hypothetical protein F4782DRAFT_513469 [Xylaria castorea]
MLVSWLRQFLDSVVFYFVTALVLPKKAVIGSSLYTTAHRATPHVLLPPHSGLGSQLTASLIILCYAATFQSDNQTR